MTCWEQEHGWKPSHLTGVSKATCNSDEVNNFQDVAAVVSKVLSVLYLTIHHQGNSFGNGGFHSHGGTQNRCFIMDIKPLKYIKMDDDWGIPPFVEPPKWIDIAQIC